MLKFLKTAQKDALGFEGAMNAVTSELKNFFTASNITRSVIEKVIESTITLAIAQDKVLSSFNKSSAAAGRYNDLIIDLERTHILYGVGTAEAAAVTFQNLMGSDVEARRTFIEKNAKFVANLDI